MIKIYTLQNPITNEIFYVGKAKNIQKRLSVHICEASKGVLNEKKDTILTILREGKYPIIEEIEEVEDHESAAAERYWINQFMAWGFSLSNVMWMPYYYKDNYFYIVKQWLLNQQDKIFNLIDVINKTPTMTPLEKNYSISRLKFIWEETKQDAFIKLGSTY